MINHRDFVSPADWIDSYYYCGDVSKYLYPFWKERFIEICSSDNVSEVILTGSIGGGKTYFANVLLLRKLYELAVLGDDVWDVLGLAKGSAIFFIYFSISMMQAKFTGYRELVNMVDTVPFFFERFPRDRSVDGYLRFPRNVFVITGSKFQHQIGLNVLGSVLDEANFRLEKDKFKAAFDLYTTIIERRLSRFAITGKEFGLSVLISSAVDVNSFVETRIAKVEGKDNVRVVRVVGIDVKSNLIKQDDGSFVVFVGEGNLVPKIVDSHIDWNEIVRVLGLNNTVDETVDLVSYVRNNTGLQRWFKVVPQAFRQVFESDIIGAVRDVLGIPIGGSTKLMRSPQIIDEAIDSDNLFDREIIELSMYDEIRLQDYFLLHKVRDKGKARCIHCDLSLGKEFRTGMSCAYIDGIKRDDLGRVLPIVRVEWIVAIERSVRNRMDDEIPLWKIRDFLLWLKGKGVNIVKVTFDSFQSADMIQLLKRGGMEVDRLSVDVSDEQYVNLAQLYMERRIKHCRHELYRREILSVDWYRDKRKIERAEGGTKDVADAVCGAVWNVVKNFDVSAIWIDEFERYGEEEVEIDERRYYNEMILDQLKKEAKKKRMGNWWEFPTGV